MDLGFVKFKSNGTTAKRPLKQIQKTQGAKEKQFFWFSLGVLHGFSRKSNEVDLGFVKFKSSGIKAKRPLEQIQKTQAAKKKEFFWFSLGVLHGFSRKSNGGWIFLGIKRGLQNK